MFRRLVREPLLHFALLSLLIFLAHSVFYGRPESGREKIVVSPARVEQLTGLFEKTWQRQPTPEEMKALIDDYVAGEVYYREARRLGLDADDEVIRQRLRLKMELMIDLEVDQLSPDDAELAAFLSANPGRFAIEPQLAFEQVLLSPEKRGVALEADAARLLGELRAGAIDPTTAGDSTLLPFSLPITPVALIAREFGDEFAAAIDALPEGEWSGPVRSGYGLHLVRILKKQKGRAPSLDEVRETVIREWKASKREALRRERLESLARRYDIIVSDGVEPSAGSGTGKQ